MFPSVPEYFKAPCVFPFTYDDLTYYSCISVHSDYAWCSLDERFHGRWRYCTAKDPPMCTFPFRFRDRLFQTCTKVGYIFNRTWCSLTSNYDADGKWKQCSPYKYVGWGRMECECVCVGGGLRHLLKWGTLWIDGEGS
ncbi:Seminal plasma protein BSP-30 kDa [Myotis brandtii]|uniref:Seminal plasma protein BSP-30 kDa n=1 Tax=Myotis brandtii TaxID=109478 RepID=S7NFA6_MYOBR|nr:Seminal plasma protein BSP-30 kDa [Myotis brandtii]